MKYGKAHICRAEKRQSRLMTKPAQLRFAIKKVGNCLRRIILHTAQSAKKYRFREMPNGSRKLKGKFCQNFPYHEEFKITVISAYEGIYLIEEYIDRLIEKYPRYTRNFVPYRDPTAYHEKLCDVRGSK
jgi:hypothetical protein